jgi:hypothetical protein
MNYLQMDVNEVKQQLLDLSVTAEVKGHDSDESLRGAVGLVASLMAANRWAMRVMPPMGFGSHGHEDDGHQR